MDRSIHKVALVAAFQPTDKHYAIRERVKQYAPISLLAKLGPENIDLLSSILPRHLVDYIKETAEDYPEVMDWLTTEDEADLLLLHARRKAAERLVSILDMETEDPKLVSLQLKAADSVLNQSKKPAPKVEKNQTLNITGMPRLDRQMAAKSAEELELELLQLQGG